MRTIRRKLNIVPGGIPVLIKLNQYDSDYSLVFELYSTDGVFTVPSGSTAKICGTKRSGTGYSADASISGTTVTVTGDVQMTAAAGTNVYEIVLYNGTKKLHTSNIILLVERAALDADTITDDTVLRELNAIIEGAETATRAADRAEAAAASIDFGLDVTPTQGSSNAVSSGGVYEALHNIDVTTDATLSISGKPADAKAVGDALADIDVETDTTLSIAGKPADAEAVGNLFDELFVEETIRTTITSTNVVDTAKRINASGDIVDYAQYTNINIWAIPINGEFDGIIFNVIPGTAYVKYIAFYNAETYAECNANTLVSISQYTNNADNNYSFPADAKMCLINYRSFNSGYLYATIRTKKADAVDDAESVSDMINDKQIYRLDGKLYYNDGDDWIPVGSGDGDDSDILNLVIEDKVTKDYIASPDNVAEYKDIDANGNIVDQTTYHTYIWAVPIETPYTGIGFNVIKGNGKYLGFYTAENFAECDSTTLIQLINYSGGTNVEYPIPEGTKMCLINYRGDYYGGYLYTVEKVSKAIEEMEDFRKELNTKIGSIMTVADLGGTFVRGRLNVTNGEVISSVYQCINTEDITIDRTIQISFDSDVYNVSVYYNNGDNTYSNNGGATTENARTILKGSTVRFNISKKNSGVRLTDGELVTLPQSITFNTALEDWKEYVNDNCNYEALCAKMYEKGGSEKSFSNAVGILAAGQSNIAGRVPSEDLPPDIVPPFANIKPSVNSKTGIFQDSVTLKSKWGVDFSLYDALNKLGQDFYVIKWSEGGTSISSSPYATGNDKWTPFYEELDSISKSLLWSFEEQIRACITNNPNTFNPRALIWHQGEGDFSGGSKKAALAYYKNFKCLIAYIRGIVGNERLPVIYGTISHNSGQYCPIVEEAQLKIAQEDPYAHCIDMSGAGLIDSYHFDADACVYFGRMAYDALIDFGVITGTKINPVCPWQN